MRIQRFAKYVVEAEAEARRAKRAELGPLSLAYYGQRLQRYSLDVERHAHRLRADHAQVDQRVIRPCRYRAVVVRISSYLS
jgi:hypothetical protein